MPMPILKGLVGAVPGMEDEAAPVDASAVLSLADLTADELEALQTDAEDALASGALDSMPMPGEAPVEGAPVEEGAETAADEAAESPEQQAEEAATGAELHSTTEFVEQAQAGVDECNTLLEELQAEIDELEDPKMADALLTQAEEACAAVEDIAKEAEKALKDDNITMAAAAAAQVDEVKSLLADSISQVKEMALIPEEEELEEEPEVAPVVPAAKGGKTAPVARPLPPLAAWAAKASGAKGCH